MSMFWVICVACVFFLFGWFVVWVGLGVRSLGFWVHLFIIGALVFSFFSLFALALTEMTTLFSICDLYLRFCNCVLETSVESFLLLVLLVPERSQREVSTQLPFDM